jgi:hypothetical protein
MYRCKKTFEALQGAATPAKEETNWLFGAASFQPRYERYKLPQERKYKQMTASQ